MAFSQTTSKDSTSAKDKGKKGSEEGKVYEKLSLALLAKNGYELSKHNSKFLDFAIGREVGLGTDGKFDDNVFRYTDDDNTNKLIFVQIKHKQEDHQINSQALSAEAATAKGGGDGGMRRDFNLQKYFISYLSVREELKNKNLSEECRNGKIKYVAIFTNVGFDTEELISKGFCLKEAPGDITKLFTLRTKEHKHCYQLSKISEDLRKILMKSSDLHRVAKELAQYAVWKNLRETKIMGIDTSPIKHYHVPLARDVIQKSDQVENKSSKIKTKKEQYCEAQFRDEFLENDEIGSKQLRDAVYEAIRELDESKKSLSDEELKKHLKGIKWKTVPNFGKTKKNKEIILPCEWTTLKEEDITDFLKCLVFAVNRPRVNELRTLFLCSVQDTVVDRHYSTPLKEIVDKLENTGPELRERIEQDLGIYETASFEEKWTSGDKIVKFLDEQKQQISVSFFVTAMTLIYESEMMQFGKFNESEKMEKCLGIFFSNSAKILCINTSQTLLSSIKILQYLNSKKYNIAEDGRIYTNLDTLKSKENRDSVAKAFELERNVLLVIECRHTLNEQDVEEFYKKLYTVVNAKPNKKIIIIIPEEEHNNLLEKMTNDFQNKDNFMLEYDVIDIKYFEPKEDPFKKKVIIFQGQDKRVSLSDIAGIDKWNSYVHSIFQGTNEQGVVDGMTLVKILNNDEIEVGSKPVGTSSLEGAYAQMYEEINVETLVNKLMSQEHDNNANDMYVISGITGSSEEDKTGKLIRCLGLDYRNSEFKNRSEEFKNRLKTVSVNNLKVFDDQFKDRNFKEICHRCPEKRIFWICLEWDKNATKFMLQEIYNPKFYLKRKFKNVIIKKDLKEHLIKDDLSEIFIFHCAEDKQELYNSMQLNEREIEQFENSCMIKIFSQKSDAEADFELSEQEETVHLLEFKEKQIVWCNSHGLMKSVQEYIDQKQSEISLVEEDKLVGKIKERKVVILADDPGMGKTTTLTKLYETEIESSSIIKSHWVVGIKLKDNLKAVRDLEFKKDCIDNISVVEFLSSVDLNLNNNLAKNLLKIALDKSKNFKVKPLLLAFDGFDEVLDVKDRNLILLLLKFIKNETAAKIWISTRLHFKTSLEKELSTIAIEFVPMDDPQKIKYITKYLYPRLYLILNETIFNDHFTTCNEKQEIKSILIYTTSFLNQMKKTFKDKMSRFIGTPLQLQLMLEGSIVHFKIWLENEVDKIPVFDYLGNNVFEIYEHFIDRKYEVYFQKEGIRERMRQEQEKFYIDQYHKDFAQSKIVEVNPEISLDEFRNIYLLVGVIKSQGSDLEFIHKTFEEFFAAKAFIEWIIKGPIFFSNTNRQEYLLKVIFMKPDYELVRTFMNLQLQKLSAKATNDERQYEFDKSLEHYGAIAEKLLKEENSPLIGTIGTSLHIAINENNKNIAWFLLNSLKGHSDAQRKFLFAAGEYTTRNNASSKGTALHLACWRDDVEIVKVLLDAAEGISKVALQEFLKCLNGRGYNALTIVAINSHNVKIFNELLSRSNDKLDLILTGHSALCVACLRENEVFVDFLLQEFEHDKHSLKKLLLYNGALGNALSKAKDINVVEKLISAAKSIEDNNETLKNLLLPEIRELPLNSAVYNAKMDVVEMLLNAAKEIGDDNHTLKQLLLNERRGKSALHDAAIRGDGDIIKLLLETAAHLGIEFLEKLTTAVDEKGNNTIKLMFDHGHERIFADSFKMLEEDKYQNIRNEVMEMFGNVLLESRLCSNKKRLHWAIQWDYIKEVKDILNNAKNSSFYPNENLRVLLLAKDYEGRNTLSIACAKGYSKIIKLLISYAKKIEDGNHTLKELFWNERYGDTALHTAAESGYVDVIKLLLKTAADLGIEMLEELITAVGEEGKNAIQLMFEYDHENIFDDSFKMLEEDKYQNIRKKVKEMYENARLESRLCQAKKRLITAIEDGNIKEVKHILSNAKNSSVSPSKSLRVLLLADKKWKGRTLAIACAQGYSEITKLLISYAKETEDGNHTLKELLWNERYGDTALHIAAECGHVDVIKLLLKTAADLGIEMLEELITAVDEKGKNAIQLMYKHGHGRIFADSFKMLEEDKYQNIRKKVMEMFENVPLESRLFLEKEKLITAIEDGNIKEVKHILSNAKNFSDSPSESLRVLLLAKGYKRRSTLSIACARGYLEIIEQLISYAKETVDYNHTLKHLLLNERFDTALHIAVENGCVDVIKLLLKTAADLGIEMLKKLIYTIGEEGKNAIQLMFEHSHEISFHDSYKLFEEDNYQNIPKKITEMFENVPLEIRLCTAKEKLITAIEDVNIKEVKHILSNAKNFDERLRILLLAEDFVGKSLFHIACERGNSEIIKELISYAMNMNDEGTTLKELLTKACSELRMLSRLGILNDGYTNEMKEIVKSLIFEAKNNNRIYAIYVFKKFKEQLTEVGLKFYQKIFRRIRSPFRRIRSSFRRIELRECNFSIWINFFFIRPVLHRNMAVSMLHSNKNTEITIDL